MVLYRPGVSSISASLVSLNTTVRLLGSRPARMDCPSFSGTVSQRMPRSRIFSRRFQPARVDSRLSRTDPRSGQQAVRHPFEGRFRQKTVSHHYSVSCPCISLCHSSAERTSSPRERRNRTAPGIAGQRFRQIRRYLASQRDQFIGQFRFVQTQFFGQRPCDILEDGFAWRFHAAVFDFAEVGEVNIYALGQTALTEASFAA